MNHAEKLRYDLIEALMPNCIDYTRASWSLDKINPDHCAYCRAATDALAAADHIEAQARTIEALIEAGHVCGVEFDISSLLETEDE